jgi:hypothetical protein
MKTLFKDFTFQYSHRKDEFEALKNDIETCNYFKSLNQFDKTYRGDIGDHLNIFYKKILQQPFAFSEDPGTFSDYVELANDRFAEVIYGIDINLTEFTENDPEAANLFFKKILYTTENVLRITKEIGYKYSCPYIETPLFITLMEFIQSIKKIVTQPATYYPEIEKYFAEMEKYKERFISTHKPAKHVKAFNEYFVPSYAETLPQALKSAFAGDNKTTLAVLIHVLMFECEPRLLIVEKGDFKAFHEAMVQYFSGQDIGERPYYITTSRGLEGNKTRQPEIKSSKDRINAILQSIDNK